MLLTLMLVLASRVSTPADPVYGPLWLYDGSWRISSTKSGTAKPDQLTNQCAQIGKYMACQQTVNGSVTELLVFLPSKTSGAYYTQSVMPDGRAGGRGDLTIDGDKWTFSNTWNQGGKSTYYRTTNVFIDKNRIHYEQQESTNNRDWTTTNSGDEVRAGKPK